MKNTKTLIAALTALTFAFVACGEKKTTEAADPHAGHNHAKGEHKEEAVDPHAGHDHAKGEHKEEATEDHSGHAHAKKTAGPNGGKVITVIKPHAEFLVTPERKIRITFLSADNKPAAIAQQSVSLILGSRSAPVTLALIKEADGMSLLSETTIPEGNNIDTYVTFKLTPDAKPVRSKFILNMSDCPNCDYLEYACTCDHGHDH